MDRVRAYAINSDGQRSEVYQGPREGLDAKVRGLLKYEVHEPSDTGTRIKRFDRGPDLFDRPDTPALVKTEDVSEPFWMQLYLDDKDEPVYEGEPTSIDAALKIAASRQPKGIPAQDRLEGLVPQRVQVVHDGVRMKYIRDLVDGKATYVVEQETPMWETK